MQMPNREEDIQMLVIDGSKGASWGFKVYFGIGVDCELVQMRLQWREISEFYY
jgi:hypothetical protein